ILERRLQICQAHVRMRTRSENHNSLRTLDIDTSMRHDRRMAMLDVAPDAAAPPDTGWALGPGAVSWKVLPHPAVYVSALLREGTRLTLHPQSAAAAIDHARVHQDRITRYRTIARYAYSTVYGPRADAERVASFVRRNHDRVVGVEPITGLDYQAHSSYEL